MNCFVFNINFTINHGSDADKLVINPAKVIIASTEKQFSHIKILLVCVWLHFARQIVTLRSDFMHFNPILTRRFDGNLIKHWLIDVIMLHRTSSRMKGWTLCFVYVSNFFRFVKYAARVEVYLVCFLQGWIIWKKFWVKESE